MDRDPKQAQDRQATGQELDGDEALVRLARRGDRRALDALIRTHGGAVRAILRKITGDPHRADDIAQEAFLRAIDAIRRIRSGVPFRPWLIAIARNIAIDWSRRSKRYREVEMQNPDILACADSVAEPRRSYDAGPRVWNAVRRLSERDRRLVVLRYGRGLTNIQVARECGVSEDAVKVSLHRSRRRLRKLVGRLDPDE